MAATTHTYLISRTDAIGDVVLTLPMAGWLKKNRPGCRVVFLGKTYTKPVIACCPNVDVFLNWDEIKALPNPERIKVLKETQIDTIVHVFPDKEIAVLAKSSGIKNRIGTRSRWFHWFTCNKLVALSRRHSTLHESQLNVALLKPAGLNVLPPVNELPGLLDLSKTEPLPDFAREFLKPNVPHIILHPKSKGSGREWSLEHFAGLAKLLHQRGVQVFISGSSFEHDWLKNWLEENKNWVTDITGKLTLPQFISFIKACDGLVGSGTGPLHLAAGLGVHALGIFPPIKPIHPGRWAPVGPKAEFQVVDKNCNNCAGKPQSCVCINEVSVIQVLERIESWIAKPD